MTRYSTVTRYSIHTESGNGWTSARWARWDQSGLTLSPIFPDPFEALCAAFVDSFTKEQGT